MSGGELKHILCAVRGVPQSRETVTRAIDLALENRARLTFVHVVDVEFLEHATIGPLSVVYNELVEMATFAMMILCDRAQRRGVEDAGYAIREGNTREQLLQFAVEAHADLMIMGRPSPRRYGGASQGGDANAFAAQIEEQAGIKVLQVGPAGTQKN